MKQDIVSDAYIKFIKSNVGKMSFDKMAVILSNKYHVRFTSDDISLFADLINGASSKPYGNGLKTTKRKEKVHEKENKAESVVPNSAPRHIQCNGNNGASEVTVHLNGDMTDFRPENLYKLTKQEHRIVARFLKSGNEQLSKTACIYAQLKSKNDYLHSLLYRRKNFPYLLTEEEKRYLFDCGYSFVQ